MAVVVIGDLVGSRRREDRQVLHAKVQAALAEANEACRPVVPLAITAGDEHQGTFETLGAAVAATLRIRLALLPDADTRHGIARGDLTVLQESPRVEDGPAWWAARDAIDEVESLAASGMAHARTKVAGEDAVNAALLGRDELIGRLDARGLSVLRGLMSGRTQREVAEELGISPSAVSQRVRRDGLAVVIQMDDWLGRLG